MARKSIIKGLFLLAAVFVCGGAVQAQTEWSQATACPGWNNPANFNAGDATNYYTGQTGTRSSGVAPNVMTGTTGMAFSSSNSYSRSALANVTLNGNYSDCATFPTGYSQSNAFAIMSGSGHDANTGNQLPFVPTQFNTNDTTGRIVNTNIQKSIRVGDACGNTNAVSLCYNVYVTPQNAMFYIYYACVVEDPGGGGHGATNDPAFIIRVLKQNSSGNWVQVSDTLAYMQTATEPSQGGTLQNGVNGWHKSNSTYSVWWKEWSKVSINLSNHLYENLRIEVQNGDCGYSQHFAYAYIAGECRPMRINSSGCPPGMATDVTTLMAPRDLRNYVWYASEYGLLPDGEESSSIYTWRQLTPDNGPALYDYNVQASDFHITRRMSPSGATTVVDSTGNWQTFRCKLTSALDPNKPFDSYLYASVQNTKPSMFVDSTFDCDGKVTLWNRSEVPGNPALVIPGQTLWQFYNNPDCGGEAMLTLTGASAEGQFNERGLKGVRVRTVTSDAGCYSEAIYPLRPRFRPNAGMSISERVLCDADETTLVDTTQGTNNTRVWYFRAENAADDDMTLSDTLAGSGEDNRIVTRSFTHALEPIELVVNDGTFYTDPFHGDSVVWCTTLVHDTVSVFLHPELEVTGDTVVCEGSQTNATVRALGVDSCRYEWSMTLGEVSGGFGEGATLKVTPYADKATYYVKVTSPQGCVAWDSIHAYLVRPKLSMTPEDGRICPGDRATLTGSDADHYTWTASPNDPTLAGQDSAARISVSPSVTTTYTMVGHGSNGCDATPQQKTVTIVPLPVPEVKLSPGFIDTDNPEVSLKDVSQYGVASSWLFNDGSVLTGTEVNHVFANCIGYDSVPVTLTSYNELNCPIEYPFYIPVSVYTAWFPQIFTPGSADGNSKFRLYTINDYSYFHIYIYNRRGELVYDSDDMNFEWDGTCKGEPCPQGAYVYTCRFLKTGTPVMSSMQGSVTLIR